MNSKKHCYSIAVFNSTHSQWSSLYVSIVNLNETKVSIQKLPFQTKINVARMGIKRIQYETSWYLFNNNNICIDSLTFQLEQKTLIELKHFCRNLFSLSGNWNWNFFSHKNIDKTKKQKISNSTMLNRILFLSLAIGLIQAVSVFVMEREKNTTKTKWVYRVTWQVSWIESIFFS